MHSFLHKTAGLGAVVLALALLLGAGPAAAEGLVTLRDAAVVEDEVVRLSDLFAGIGDPALAGTPVAQAPEPGVSVDVGARGRSGERSVWNECVSTCRSRWSTAT